MYPNLNNHWNVNNTQVIPYNPNASQVTNPEVYRPSAGLLDIVNGLQNNQFSDDGFGTSQENQQPHYIPYPNGLENVDKLPVYGLENVDKLPVYKPQFTSSSSQTIPTSSQNESSPRKNKTSFFSKIISHLPSINWPALRKVKEPTVNENMTPVVGNNNLYPPVKEQTENKFAPSAPLMEEISEVSNKNIIQQVEVKPILESPKTTVVNKPLLESIVLTPDSYSIPVISYVDLEFGEELKDAKTYQDVCHILPKHALRDVLLHLKCYGTFKGKAETIIENHINEEINSGRGLVDLKVLLNEINQNEFSLHPHGISQELLSKGETILKTHYALPTYTYTGIPEICALRNKECTEEREKFHVTFTNYIDEIKGTSLFYKYVYEQAVAAKVKIEDWDKQFSEYNWNKKTMQPLSIQALERCLHGQK